jgi:Carboxypeptidase regulatory-like domain
LLIFSCALEFKNAHSPVLLLLFFPSYGAVLCAQTTNGSISGRVTDPSKAVIVDAKVAAINVDTTVGYEGATNALGEYHLTHFLPGSYRIEIEKAGFQKLIKLDVILHIQDVFEIDFQMTIGSGSENITVKGGAPLVQTMSSEISGLVKNKKIEGLPLNGTTLTSACCKRA